MTDKSSERIALPPIPAKRYFTIGEVSELCAVKPHVLRYWEQEFTQLKPVKRRGNRRYYQHHEVLLIRRIRELLYEQGFTINGARNRLDEVRHHSGAGAQPDTEEPSSHTREDAAVLTVDLNQLRGELVEVQHLLAQLKEIAKHG
ncbi:MerR family transcriptional regulator [Cupriavidus plantarum]|uniref:MerR family transcriptional regulator n=1 Tax=Cupriavidus plantarum TaxID=942865 RepID=UPI000E259EA6|nr:MerR family transcriptional regulator [Cupriavidus plantarum]REF01573.1 MerR family transcriptional regulator [Cupriavidus plantarum]